MNRSLLLERRGPSQLLSFLPPRSLETVSKLVKLISEIYNGSGGSKQIASAWQVDHQVQVQGKFQSPWSQWDPYKDHATDCDLLTCCLK